MTRSSRRIYVCRHGERIDFVNPAWPQENPDLREDPFLTPTGLIQAAALGKTLEGCEIAHILTSPFVRCVSTSQAAAQAMGFTRPVIKVEVGLSEWLRTICYNREPLQHMIPAAHLVRTCPLLDWKHNSFTDTPTYPEDSESGMFTRCAEAVKMILHEYPTGNLLLVSHGSVVEGVIKALCPSEKLPGYIAYTSLTEIVVDVDGSTAKCIRINDDSHLPIEMRGGGHYHTPST